MTATTVYANDGSAKVTSGGTTAPSSGTTETWTLSGSTLPAVSSGVTQCFVADPAAESEKILITNITGTTASVTRGAESTTPVAHAAGFTIQNVVTAATLTALATQAYADGNVGGIPFPQAPFAAGKHGPLAPQPGKVLTTFQSGHGYTNNAGSTFTANDTADFIMGTQACKIVTGGSGASANVSNTGQPSFSAAGRFVRLRLKVDDITHMASLNFFLGSSSLANNYKWTIQGGAAGSNYVISGQWLTVTLGWHDATVTGSPSRSALTDVRLQVADDASAAVTAHFQSVELIPDCSATFPSGVVSVCFDDSYESMYQLAMPKLTQYGYPAQVFTIQSLIGGSGRLTLAQLKSLQDQLGWALASHAYTDTDHGLTLTGMTAAQADTDTRQMKAWGDANGFRASAGYAYPKGQYGLTTDSAYTTDVIRPYLNYARTTNSRTKETFPPADPYRLRAISDISSFSGGYAPSNLTGTGGDLDKCAANQTWLILTFHNIVTASPAATTDILQSDFNAIIDGINSHGIPVLAVEDVLRSMDQTYPAASVTLDATAADIQPATTQAVSAGSTGKAVDAGHAHPSYQYQPSDHGLLSWAYDPAVSVATSTPLTNAGTANVVKLHVPEAQNITNILLYLSTQGSGLTSGQCFAALYQGGSLLGTTADQSTAWAASPGLKTMAISGGPVAVAAGDVYVAYWYNGTTGPAPLRGNSSASVNLNLAAASPRWGTANTGLTTTAPGTLGTISSAVTAYWAGLS